MEQEIVGIFSIPKEFRISWAVKPIKNVRFKSFEDLAQEHDVPLIYVTRKMSDPVYQEALRRLQPDILIVIGWYYMVPRALRELAPLGAVGVHASLLPKYRGGAPLVWAIINGETQTGVSFFHFADGVDDGDLIGQANFDIAFEDDISDVVFKASTASVQLVCDYVPLLGAGKAPRIPQDHSLATVMPQRKPEDGLIVWHSKSGLQVYNWIRAQTRPYPGAFTYLGQEKVTIWKARVSDVSCEDNAIPGTIVVNVPGAPGTFGVCCADGRILRVHEVGLVDGAVMSGAEFVATRAISTGTVLGAAEGK
jgi:methionyl-tRNA formyltransferase